MVNYYFVCVIFKVISRSIEGQIIEKWAFSEYKYHFFLSISLRIIYILLFFGIVLMVLILLYHDFYFVSYSRSFKGQKKIKKLKNGQVKSKN